MSVSAFWYVVSVQFSTKDGFDCFALHFALHFIQHSNRLLLQRCTAAHKQQGVRSKEGFILELREKYWRGTLQCSSWFELAGGSLKMEDADGMEDDKSLNKELCWIPGRVLEDLTGPVLEIVNPWDQFKAAVWVVFFERFLHYNCPELSGLWLYVVVWHHELWVASERENVHNPPFSLMHTLKSSHLHFLLVWYMISSRLCVQLLLQNVKKKEKANALQIKI